MAPVIGIPSRIRTSNFLPFMGVGESYVESVISAGGIPLIIPLNNDEKALEKLYSLINGILLPGGEDVQPSLYGESAHKKLGTTCSKRDRLESALIKMASRDKKPVLAICRGIQILNVTMEGTLFQDLPEQTGKQGHSNEPPEAWTGKTHLLNIESGTKLSRILKIRQSWVNSLHHQAVKDVAPGFKVAAYSEDGLIEAIESENDWFALGVQCHPETLWQGTSVEWKNLFIEFISQSSQFKL